MNDRYRSERHRSERDPRHYERRESGGWQRSRGDDAALRARSQAPRYSSDEDETYGSEWDREDGSGSRISYDRDESGYGRGAGGYGDRSGEHPGGYGHGYAGSTGPDYGRGNFGGPSRQGQFGGGQPRSAEGQGYGNSQGLRSSGGFYAGAGYSGESAFGRERGFGGGMDQGYRGRDFGGPGADLRTGGFAGRGPKGYKRTDERIREDVCERLSRDDDVDASEIEVRVKDGEVTLDGSVMTRSMKHHAENLAEDVSGVRDVTNNLKVVKGMLSELKDKLTGDEREQHFANGGTKNSPAGSMSRAG